ncbi:MAG: ferrous iron transport protein B [Deltaproteobacteria bacterium]|nr:ferrous iron transport protein B [Deltaproteobacteria bacterium]
MTSQTNKIAIAGNPNSGKTTAFNRYTGARQHVGNYPGITVEKKDGVARVDGKDVVLVDLPGTYSLTAYSMEEVVARRVLAEERPGAVIDVINAGVLDRNLYLSVQMMEMGIPLVLTLNMMDEARAMGLDINLERLSELTGLQCFPAVARKGEGLDDSLRAALKLSEETNGRVKPLEISYGSDLDVALLKMTPVVEEAGLLTDHYPARWTALKYLEGDKDIIERGKRANPDVHGKLVAMAAGVAKHMKETLNTHPEAMIADYRYGWISSVLKNGVLEQRDDVLERAAKSDKVDEILTHRFLGPIILIAVLYLMYVITIEVGNIPLGWTETFFEWLEESIGGLITSEGLNSLVTKGIIAGVGGVLGFVPLIVIMFFLIALLEDSGYMARVAYMMDRIFRIFGLHGASIMPFIISGGIAGGCAVPGVMATRTLRSPRERLATILTAPFMVCGAKIPVFLLFTAVFFPENQALYMFSFTLLGWFFALIVARILRSTLIRGKATPFVMELPPYRWPVMTGVLLHTWERTWQYIKKAGTVILGISILLWALMAYPGLPEERHENMDAQMALLGENRAGLSEETSELVNSVLANEQSAEALRHSYAGRLGTMIEPVTGPAGFNWQTTIALIGGIAAKEVVISTLSTAYALGEEDTDDPKSLRERIRSDPSWTSANSLSLLVFTLLYSPCFVTLVIIKRESGKWRWLFFSLFFNLALALALAVLTYQLLAPGFPAPPLSAAET